MLQWTPVQISGRLKEKEGVCVSAMTGSIKAGRGCIPDRIDIDTRPPIIDEKIRIGDFELDTIIDKNHKGALVSIVAGASKYTMLMKVKYK